MLFRKPIFTSLLVLSLLAGCTSNVSVDYDKATNFAAYRTYSLLPKSEKSTEDVRLSSPMVDKRITRAIEQNMSQKGFRKQDEKADIKIEFRLDLKQEISSDGSGVTMVFGTGTARSGFGIAYSLPGSDVRTYDRGVLTIDFMSAKTNQLIWRGTSSRRIYDASTPEASEKLINSVVKEILEKYPPK